jgi:hypothetical protein
MNRSFKELCFESVVDKGVMGVIKEDRDSIVFFNSDWSCGRF